MTQTPDADTVKTTGRWQWTFDIPNSMMDDKPMLDSVLAHNVQSDREAAAIDGVHLVGEPVVHSEAAYWEKNFGERGGLVGKHLAGPEAIAAGPKMHRYWYTWQSRPLNLGNESGSCAHCPDGHTPFQAGAHPWNVFVDTDVFHLREGKPTRLIVERSAGEHVAQADADALYELINGRKP